MVKLQLHENWQLCNVRKLDWVPAQVPGDIYAAFFMAGKMSDPFFEDNEYQAKALMEEDYEYRMKNIVQKFVKDYELYGLSAEELQDKIWSEYAEEFARAVLQDMNDFSDDELFEIGE